MSASSSSARARSGAEANVSLPSTKRKKRSDDNVSDNVDSDSIAVDDEPQASVAAQQLDAQQIVQQFANLPDEIRAEVLEPLKEHFGGVPHVIESLADEIQHQSDVLVSRSGIAANSLVAMGERGAGKSVALMELAGGAERRTLVLPSAAGGVSVTLVTTRLWRPNDQDDPNAPIELRLRLSTPDELADALIDVVFNRHKDASAAPTADAEQSAMLNATVDDLYAANPHRSVRSAEELADALADAADVKQSLRALKSAGAIVDDCVTRARGAALSRDVALVAARRALAVLEPCLVRPRQPMAVDAADGVVHTTLATKIDARPTLWFGSFDDDRAAQRMIELVIGAIPRDAIGLVYMFDVCSARFRFPSDFQVFDLPGLRDIKNSAHVRAVARSVAHDESVSWLVLSAASRLPDGEVFKSVFTQLLPSDGKAAVAPPIVAMTMVLTDEELQKQQENQQHVGSSAELRDIQRKTVEATVIAEVGRFNGSVVMARPSTLHADEREVNATRIKLIRVSDGSVLVIDKPRWLKGKRCEPLPDYEAHSKHVFDSLRWLKTRHALSTTHIKLVNLRTMAAVAVRTAQAGAGSGNDDAGKLAERLNVVGRKCKPLALIVSDAFVRHARLHLTEVRDDGLLDIGGADRATAHRVIRDEVRLMATAFWHGTATELLVRNVRALVQADSGKNFKLIEVIDEGDDVADSRDENVRAVLDVVRAQCALVELPTDDGDDNNCADDGDNSDDDDFVDDVSDENDDDAGDADGAKNDSAIAEELKSDRAAAAARYRFEQMADESIVGHSEAMLHHVEKMGSYLLQLAADRRASVKVQSEAERSKVAKKLTEALKAPSNKLTVFAEKERGWYGQVLELKCLDRHLNVMPPMQSGGDVVQIVERERARTRSSKAQSQDAARAPAARVPDGDGTSGARLHSRMAGTTPADELPIIETVALAAAQRKFPDAVGEFEALISAGARERLALYVNAVRALDPANAVVSSAVNLSMQQPCLVSEKAVPLWVVPTFVPVTAAAIKERRVPALHLLSLKGAGLDESAVAHLIVLTTTHEDKSEVAREAMAALKEKEKDGVRANVVVLALPAGLPLHPTAEEFALAFARDVLSQHIGAYIDFCLMPSTFHDFGELNLALNKVRTVSTCFALHYMEAVLEDVRAHCVARLLKINNAHEGDGSGLYEKRSELVQLMYKVLPSIPAEELPACGSLDGNKPAAHLANGLKVKSGGLMCSDAIAGSVLACVRLAAHLRAAVAPAAAPSDELTKAHNLFEELMGDVVDACLGAWCVTSPYRMFSHKQFRTPGADVVESFKTTTGVSPVLCSTLSLRSMTFVRGGKFSITQRKGGETLRAFARVMGSMSKHQSSLQHRCMVRVKLINWRTPPKMKVDETA